MKYQIGEGLEGEAIAALTRTIDGETFNFVVVSLTDSDGCEFWSVTHFESGQRIAVMQPMSIKPNAVESDRYLRNLVRLGAHAAIERRIAGVKAGEARVREVIARAPSNSYQLPSGTWLKRNRLSDFAEIAS